MQQPQDKNPPPLEVEKVRRTGYDKNICRLGQRIVDISYVIKQIRKLEYHECSKEGYLLCSNELRNGLQSRLIFKCP